MITFNLGNDSPKKDKQQDIKIADLQAAVDELNTQIDAISTTLGNLSASIDDKYAAQTQTLMNALTAQINSLSSALESALTTGQLTAQIANIERLMVTVSAGFVALEAETAKIESLEAEGIESDSVKADSAEIQTLSAEKAVFNEATITLLNMLALTVQSLTSDTASIKEVTAEKINSEKIETDLLNAEHIAGGAWHTPISTPDNTELLHISIPRYNGMAQLQTEDNEFNVSILNNYLISYNQRGEYLYRIERKGESVDIYLQNIGDTVNYRVLFVGSETSGTVTSELVDKTDYRQTITDFAGVLSLESVVLGVNILFCDYLPDEGEENNLYVVKTQGTCLWNENTGEFIPLMGTSWQTKILSNESKIGDLTELSTEAKTDLVSAINEVDLHADANAANISTIIGNDTGKSMREVAQEVSATVYTPQGSCTFANLPSLSASSTKVGFVYDVTDSFTTTSDFKEGAGIDVPGGTNVVVADVSGTKMWDLLGFNIDLSPYQKKVMDSSVSVAGTTQTTVEGAIRALAAAMSTIDAVYPVGTIYQNASVDTNPSTLFGVGTWEKIEGKFLYGTATGIALGSSGGAPTVTLGVANMPSHYHSTNIGSTTGSISGGITSTAKNWNGASYINDYLEANIYPGFLIGGYFSHGDMANGNGSNNNYPPFGGRFASADGHASIVARKDAYNDVVGAYAGASGGLNGVECYHFVFDHVHEINASITVKFGTKNTDSKGSGTAFSIIPPYVAVNIWKRTA